MPEDIIRMFHRNKRAITIFVLLCALVILFFLPLFYPSQKIFFTPDHSLSDVTHFNLPLKYFLSESLKNRSLPIWTDIIGEGFPVLAQGEVGTFNMFNLVLFGVFPFVTAFNLSYVVTFILFALGMYLVARQMKISRIVSFYCASVFTFTGFHIVQIPHLNHLQTFSYFPFLFWIWIRMIHHPQSRVWLLAPFIFSQQIFAGHYQYIYMEIVFFFLFLIFSYEEYKSAYASIWPKLTIAIILTLLLCAIQLLPSYEFFTLSDRSGQLFNLHRSIFTFGVSMKEYLRALNPYILGDIRNGTFIDIASESYWETLFYIGILPLLFGVLSFRFIHTSVTVKKFMFMFLILFILSMDMKSPLYVLFSFPPFSLFRIQSRFIAYASFLAILLSGITLEKITKRIRSDILKKAVLLTVIVISTSELYHFGTTYNPTIDAQKILTTPNFLTDANTSWPYRIHALQSDPYWREQLYQNGWKNLDNYTYLLNHGTPNYSMISHIPTLTVYSGISLKKHSYLERLLDIETENPEKQATLSASAINTYQLHAVKDLITTTPLGNEKFTLTHSTKPPSDDLPVFYHYSLDSAKAINYIAHKIAPALTYDTYIEQMRNPNLLKEFDAIISGPIRAVQTPDHPRDTITVLSRESTRYSYQVSNDTDGYFVQSTLYYPGWIARLNGKRVEIYPANLTGMSIYLPKGTHTVSFSFEPKTVWYGLWLSLAGILGYTILIIVYARSSIFGTLPHTS